MKITQVESPIYSKADNSTIDVQASFDSGETYSYTASPHDNTDYGLLLWADLISGKYGAISAYAMGN